MRFQVIILLICVFFKCGYSDKSNAPTPLAIGAAVDVPLLNPYPLFVPAVAP